MVSNEMVTSANAAVQNFISESDAMDFDALVAAADVSEGSSVVDKSDLENVPFVITALYFRDSDKSAEPYVACEAKNRDGKIVFVDSSTGIRQQLLDYCVQKGMAKPPTNSEDRNNADKYDWDSSMIDVHIPKQEGGSTALIVPIRLFCKNGLRASHYDAIGKPPFSGAGERPGGTTFYIA